MKRRASQQYVNRPFKRPRTMGYGGGSTRAIRSAQATRSRSNIEYKIADAAAASAAIDNTGGVVNLLNNLQRGDSYVNRFQGKTIKPTGVTLRYTMRANGDASNIMRVLCFQWLKDGTPTVSTVIQTAGTWLAGVNMDNKQYINVLSDKVWCLNDQYQNSYSQYGTEKAIYIKGKKIFPVEFASATDTVIKGGIYMLLISDSGTASHPLITYYTRVMFAD